MDELNAIKSMDPCKREADVTTEQKVHDEVRDEVGH